MEYGLLILTALNSAALAAVLFCLLKKKGDGDEKGPVKLKYDEERRRGKKSRLTDEEQFEFLMNYTGEEQADE